MQPVHTAKQTVNDVTSTSGSTWWSVTKTAGADWMEDKATKLAASLAFYTMLSIAPLLIISIKIASEFLDEGQARSQMQAYVASNVSAEAAKAVEPMIINATQAGAGVLATIISIVVLLFSASGVFGELQDSLNTIWEVKPRPDRGIWGTIKDRFFSFTMVLGVVFLLLVSLVASTALHAVSDRIGGAGAGFLWKALSFVVSLGVITVLFALIFKFLPDAKVRWRDVWVGAALTAVLFTVGKFLLGWYLGRGTTTSVYGAAGSLVAMLLWVYYSAQILFFGAEFTQAWARAHGAVLEPKPGAVKMTDEDRAQQGMASRDQLAAKAGAERTRRSQPGREALAPDMPRPGAAVVAAGTPPMRMEVMGGRRAASTSGDGKGHGGANVKLKDYRVAAGGLAAGAAGAYFLATHSDRAERQRKLDERLNAVQAKVGRLSNLKHLVEDISVYDRMRKVDKQLRHARTTIRAQDTHRPRWVVRLGDLIAGSK